MLFCLYLFFSMESEDHYPDAASVALQHVVEVSFDSKTFLRWHLLNCLSSFCMSLWQYILSYRVMGITWYNKAS